jgi:hypothetical protein
MSDAAEIIDMNICERHVALMPVLELKNPDWLIP